MATSQAELHELMVRYRVTWETRRSLAPGGGSSVVSVGYAIELDGVPEKHATADRSACLAVEDALERIALAVCFTQEAHEAHVIHVARGCFHMGTAHGRSAEIWAEITLLNRENLFQRAVAAEERHVEERLVEVVSRLRALGAQEGHWREAM